MEVGQIVIYIIVYLLSAATLFSFVVLAFVRVYSSLVEDRI